MKFLKEKKCIIISFIIGVIIASSITVYATSYFAKDVTYKDGKSVEYALNDLYLKFQASDNCKYFEFNHAASTQFDYDLGFVPSSFLAVYRISNGVIITITSNTVTNGLIALSSDGFNFNSNYAVNSTKLTSSMSTNWQIYRESYTVYVYACK